MSGKERLVRQAGRELVDIEGAIQKRVKFLAISEEADLESLSCEQPSDTRVKATHDCPLGRGASRRAVADVAYFVRRISL